MRGDFRDPLSGEMCQSLKPTNVPYGIESSRGEFKGSSVNAKLRTAPQQPVIDGIGVGPWRGV